MPGRIQVTAATSEDDAGLREILRRTPLPGSVSVTLEREPSFFQNEVDALRHDVAVTRDADSRIIAFGSRIERTTWLGGKIQTVAYLGGLRVLPECRSSSGRILLAGFRHMRELEAKHPAAATYTAIFEENALARRVLVGGRGGIPDYVDRGRLLCPALLVGRRMRPVKAARWNFQRGTVSDFPDIAAFLNNCFQKRDLAPAHGAADFLSGARWPGLTAEDFILARDGNGLIGCLAVWDMRAIRQFRVQAYNGWLKRLHGVLSLGMKSLGWFGLPRPGELLPAGFASFLAVAGNDLSLARSLLDEARRGASQRGIGFLFTCLHERDPLAPALERWPAIPSSGRLYEVVFQGDPRLESTSVPHAEAALL